MGRSDRGVQAALAAALVVAGIAGVSGQTYQGALRGAVRDSQGVVPAAEVVLINAETSAERAAMTNEVGEYAFASVLPGTYTVRVSLSGFGTEERTGVRIGTQQSLVLDFALEVGALAEQITVIGEAPLVERATATQAAADAHHASRSRERHGAGLRKHAGAGGTRLCQDSGPAEGSGSRPRRRRHDARVHGRRPGDGQQARFRGHERRVRQVLRHAGAAEQAGAIHGPSRAMVAPGALLDVEVQAARSR